jgi:hypothetical protein
LLQSQFLEFHEWGNRKVYCAKIIAQIKKKLKEYLMI